MGGGKITFQQKELLQVKEEKFLREAMAYLIAEWESIGLYIIDNLDGDPIATRPEESWFTLPDVPQILA